MRIFIADLESIARYSQSRNYEKQVPKHDKESARDYEERTWRERVHSDRDDNIFMPPMAFKESITSVASYLGVQIPGKGKSTYAKHFRAGIIISEAIMLDMKKPDVPGEWLYLNSDGHKGGSSRVWKCMPFVESWHGQLTIHCLDDILTQDVLRYHVEQAGAFIGVGRFRPQCGGFYGRFKLNDIAEMT